MSALDLNLTGQGLMSSSVTNLRPKDTEDSQFWYTFKVQCTSCRETHPKPIAVNRHVGSPCSHPNALQDSPQLGNQRDEREPR